jgi:endogenous inhibitor of DNA gyrase (YacG/DUF329 family)
MTTAPCPLCHSDVIIDDSESYEHDLVTCAVCGKDLEITVLSPLELVPLTDEIEPSEPLE